MSVLRVIAGGAVLLAAMGASAAAEPSSACHRARAPVERAVCSDPTLARLHAGVAAAYRDALRRTQGRTARAVLRREHEAFLASREAAQSDPSGSLQRYYASWLGWLQAVDGPRRRWEGVWITGEGDVRIEPKPPGRYKVLVRADEPIRGAYTCEFVGVGQRRGEWLTVEWDTKGGTEEDGAEGWTLELRLSRGVLEMREHRNGSEAERPPYCGARGSLAGSLLPARSRPEPVSAAQAAD
jgi:hypothetical protein